MKKLLLSDILTPHVTTVTPDATVDKTLRLMREQNISAIVIIEANRPVGIFTERDVVRLAKDGHNPSTTKVDDVMSKPVLSVSEQMEYREAYFFIAEHGYRHIVVVDENGELSGIVSEADFMKNLRMEFLLRIKEVGALMTKNVAVATKDVLVKDAVSLMEKKHFSCIVVEEKNRPIGILTERDIVRINGDWENVMQRSLSDVMTTPITTVTADKSLTNAMELMDTMKFRRLVVVNESGQTAGILTRHDIVKQLYSRHVELLEESLKANQVQLKSLTEELEEHKNMLAIESRLSESQRLAHIGSWEIDCLTDELWWSEETYRIFGVDPQKQEASNELFFTLVHPDDLKMVADAYQKSVEITGSYNITHRLLLKDGTVKYVNERSSTYYNEEGHPVRSVGTVQDITEKYRKDEKIERYHSMLMALVEGSTDSIFVKNKQGVYIVANEALARLLHKNLNEIIGQDDYALFPNESAKKYREDDKRIMEQQNVETFEESVHSGDKIIPFQTTKGPLIINGEVEGIYGIARDISALKENQNEIRESQIELNAIIEAIPHMLFVKDAKTLNFLRFNTSGEKLLGVNRKNLIGKNDYDLFTKEQADFFTSRDKKVLQSGFELDISEEEIETKEGKKVLHTKKVPIKDSEGKAKFLLGISEDITERKKAEVELKSLAENLARAQSIAKIGNWKFTVGGSIEWSDELYTIFGRDKNTVLSYDLFISWIHSDDQEKHHHYTEQMLALTPEKMETFPELHYRFIRPDGEVRYVKVVTECEFDENDKPIYFFGTLQDITTMARIENNYKTLFERTGTSMGIIDKDGTFSMVNQVAANLLETTREEIIGKPFFYFVEEDDVDRLKSYHIACVRGEVVPEQYEYNFITQKGNKGTGIVTAVYLADEEKTIISVIDITKRKRIELNYKNLFERTGTCMAIVEQDGTFSLVNQTFADLAESTPDALVGTGFIDLVADEDKSLILDYNQRRLKGENLPDYYEISFISKKGRKGTGIIYPVFLADTHQVVISIIDITEKKKSENALHEQTWFLTSLDKVSQVLAQGYQSDILLEKLSDILLEIFDTDRAWFLYPCNTRATEFKVLSESSKVAYSGAIETNINMPIDTVLRSFMERALKRDEPVISHEDEFEFSPDMFKLFQVKSKMMIALKPQVGDNWLMGLHQCSHKKVWSAIELKLFKAIAERASLTFSSSLLLKQLQDNEKALAEAEKTAKLGHFELDIETGVTHWSSEIHNIMGVDISQEVGPAFLSSLVFDEDWPSVEESLRRAYEQGVKHEIEYRIQRPEDNEERWIYCRGDRYYDERGENPKLIGIVQDITERKKEEDAMRLSAAVFDNTGEGIMITDPEGNIVSVNAAFCQITGFLEEDVLGKNPRLLKSEKHDRLFYEEMWHSLNTIGSWQGEIWNRRKNGEIYPEWLSLGVIRDDKNDVVNYIGLFSDITNVKKSEDQLRFLATHDPLTELPNRTLLNEQLEYALKRMKRHDENAAVLYLDIDRFKEVNDSLGHPAGDTLLQIVAKRFKEVLRSEDFVARVSGDEFVIILEDIRSMNDAGRIADTVLDAMKQPMLIEGHEVTVTSSIGIAISPADGSNCVQLLKNADSALYRAKEQGRNAYSYYSKELGAKNFELMYLHNALYNALYNEEFVVHYQPQVNMLTEEVLGAEALVRWNSIEMGLVAPGRFIPIAEETGLITQLGEWVLEESCRQIKKWKEANLPLAYVAVNLSGRQLAQDDIVENIKKIIEKTKIEAQWLELEITEGVVMQEEGNIPKLHELRALGIRLSIDDFGTGYSSLARLRNMPIDKLKIDQSFVAGIPNDDENIKITDVIIQLSKSLNMDVIAEGVETEEQKRYLLEKGCLSAQGYFYSRPQVVEELEHWLDVKSTR